jgi:anti-repressor protein
VSALEVFTFSAQPVRTVVIDGEPWFVGGDVARVLGYANPSDALARIDAEDREIRTLALDEGSRSVTRERTLINESGVYELVFGSTLPDARMFKRWVTHEVLPSIRKTGQYVAPRDNMEIIREQHAAIGTLLEHNERITAQVVTLTPRAEAWDELAAATGDYDVADAAKILARAGVETGRKRLFDQLAGDLRWIFRGHHGKWSAYQTAVDNGYLTERPQSHHHPRTGAVVLDPPQVRVTVKGLERLRVRLGSLELAQ